MMGAIALTGCTTWDDPKSENYGDAPSIEVSIAATAPTDSAFIISIVPGEGTTYYAFAMEPSEEPSDVDAATLLKGGYGNTVVNTEKFPTLTIPVEKMEPNTTYQVYAVASNDKGLYSKVAVASIKTTDSGRPTFTSFKADVDAKSATVTFNQAIGRGEGKVSGIYYKEFDWDNPVALTQDDIEVVVSGKTAAFTTAKVPAGAYVLISWEEGTFVDAVGNKCAAFASTYNEATDKFTGVYYHAKNAAWDITDANFTAPKSGSTFPKWSEFAGTITFENDVFVINEELKAGDFTVTYTNDSRTVTYKLATTDWSLAADKKTVTFKLPKATEPGDKVTVAIKDGVFYDVYGNTNSAYNSEKVYWIAFSMKKEDVLGSFTYYFNYPANGQTYNMGNFTIEEYTGDGAEPGDVVIKDLYVPGSVIYGYYVIDECKFYIYNYQKLGILNDPDSGDYGNFIQGTVSGAQSIAFNVNADGTITSSEFRILATNTDYTSGLYWEVPEGNTIFAKVNASALKKASAKMDKSFRNNNGIPTKIKVFKK